MINLLYVSASILPSPYANSVHVIKMCTAFKRRGISTTLLGIKGDNKKNLTDFYNIKDHFNIKLVSTPKNRFLRPIIYNLVCALKICTHKGDIYSRYYYAILWALIFRKSLFYEFHNSPPPNNFFINYLLRKLFKSSYFKGAIFITKRLKSHYINNFQVDENKCIVLSDCCDIPDVTSDDYELKINDIGYVGHLYEGRGIEIIIKLAEVFKNSRFHIVGGREKELAYYKSIAPSNMIFYGFMTQKELSIVYKNFTIALAPYQTELKNANKGNTVEWMSPMKIFEYMAYKKAIILSDLPPLREIGENNKELIFVHPNQIESWIDAINILQSDEQLMNDLIYNTHKKFLAEYTWDKRVSKFLNYFHYS